MSTPYEDHLYQRIDQLLAAQEELKEQCRIQRKTILFLARQLVKAVGERDRARGTAVALEQIASLDAEG